MKEYNLLNKNIKSCKLFIKGEGYLYSFSFSAGVDFISHIRFVDNIDMAYNFFSFKLASCFVYFLTKMYPSFINKCEVI